MYLNYVDQNNCDANIPQGIDLHREKLCMTMLKNELDSGGCSGIGYTSCMNFLVQNHNHYIHYCQGHIFSGTGERNRGYALLMKANKPETALYRAPTFSLLVSHGGISSWVEEATKF